MLSMNSGLSGVVVPVGLEVVGEGLRKEVVSLHHVIEHVVNVDGCVHVTIEHLEGRQSRVFQWF